MIYNHEVLKRFSINDNLAFYLGEQELLGTVVGYQLAGDQRVSLQVRLIGSRSVIIRPDNVEIINLTTGLTNNDLTLI